MYKGGQAGVTKATVTITFDNRDKKQSPLGYESYDEITVSRQVYTSISFKHASNWFIVAVMEYSCVLIQA